MYPTIYPEMRVKKRWVVAYPKEISTEQNVYISSRIWTRIEVSIYNDNSH